jgi:hypothetical protein
MSEPHSSETIIGVQWKQDGESIEWKTCYPVFFSVQHPASQQNAVRSDVGCLSERQSLRLFSFYLYKNVCKTEIYHYVRFEVLTAVVMKSTIFWDITLCSPSSVNRRFGGKYCLHLQGRKNKLSKKPAWKQVLEHIVAVFMIEKISWARNQRESRCKMEAVCSPETSVGTERTTRPYIPKDGTLIIMTVYESNELSSRNKLHEYKICSRSQTRDRPFV